MSQWTETEQAAQAVFLGALAACEVDGAMARKLRIVDGPASGFGAQAAGVVDVDLSGVRRILVISIGKAAGSMLQALVRLANVVDGREVRGVVVSPQPFDPTPSGVLYIPGAHPLPDEGSFRAARTILELLDAEPHSAETFCFFLLSGGASAMVELPLDPRISLEDTISFHRELVHSGASISEMNCVRKHFSAVKGGRLGLRANHLRQLTVMVSDVPEQQIDVLASGPTVPDRSTVAECRDILSRYQLADRLPASVAGFFGSDALEETPKPGRFAAPSVLLLSSADLAGQAQAVATALGFVSFVDNGCDEWDYRGAATYLLDRVRSLRKQHARVCLISAGEVAVQVRLSARSTSGHMTGTDDSPRGGRNQHFVLYCATQMRGGDEGLAVLSCGSDGVDGNSPAAGAVMSLEARDSMLATEWRRAAEGALNSFRSFAFLEQAGRTIRIGPTGMNLRDLRILIATPG